MVCQVGGCPQVLCFPVVCTVNTQIRPKFDGRADCGDECSNTL